MRKALFLLMCWFQNSLLGQIAQKISKERLKSTTLAVN